MKLYRESSNEIVVLGQQFSTQRFTICEFHHFDSKFKTDLNVIIEESQSNVWYIVAYHRPQLPFETLYDLPPDIETHRQCYKVTLATRLGVILVEFTCGPTGTAFASWVILTRPDEMYITGRKALQEEHHFRIVKVLQLTEDMVLLVSCSLQVDTYGLLILKRAPLAVNDRKQIDDLIDSSINYDWRKWLNFTITDVGKVNESCQCEQQQHPIVTDGGRVPLSNDKRKLFLIITLAFCMLLATITKVLHRVI
uniref:Uncharacterized protein n=1 Tax=Anopheles albimanus TaxID=7167 RepID=A0A182FPZ9_ANOAL